MRILSVNNPKYTTSGIVNFKSTVTTPNIHGNFNYRDNDDDNNESPKKSPLPSPIRKAILGVLVGFAILNDPAVHNYLYKEEVSQEELELYEYLDDVQTMRKEKGKSSAFYQLNQLYDYEQPKIKSLGNQNYMLSFELDKQKIDLQVQLDKNNKDTINGKIKIGNNDYVKYQAIFSPDNIGEFEVKFQTKNNKKYVLGRDYWGDLYKVVGDKRIPLNRKNVEKYREYQEQLKELQDSDFLRFFSNENDMWRKLNLLLLIYLVFNEAMLDARERKNRQKEDEEKPQT